MHKRWLLALLILPIIAFSGIVLAQELGAAGNYGLFESGAGPPVGPASGDLSGTYPGPSVAAITTTTGPTSLVIGAVADGQKLQRSGSTIIGVAAGDKQLDSFHANDSLLPSTNPAAIETRATTDHTVIAFDDTTQETILLESHMSEDYLSGSLTLEIHWVSSSATSGDVVWDVAFERMDAGGLDIDSESFAADQSSTDTTNATSGIITISSIAFTQAQADSIAAGDAMRLRLRRRAADGADTMVGDAQVVRVSLFQ